MNENPPHIIDAPLPLSEDYNGLMKDGLAYIQARMGSEWTNLNPSDPGVTILEQVCYALTELGYCNNFSMADILTSASGELEIKDQFYLPKEILPASPVTVTDYRKYLIDGVNGISNVLLVPLTANAPALSRVYQVYLLTDPQYSPEVAADICKAAFYYLNQARNLGELFLLPIPLAPAPFSIGGTIALEKGTDVNTVLQQVQDAIDQAVFPVVTPAGYNTRAAAQAGVDTVLDGPLLQKGYILSSTLGTKKNTLWPIDLVGIIQKVPGVLSVNDLAVYTTEAGSTVPVAQKSISSTQAEILTVNINACTQQAGMLTITVNGTPVTVSSTRPLSGSTAGSNPNTAVSLVYGETADYTASLPVGHFRDISTYYPLQDTMPAIYGVGSDAASPDGSAFQSAQSRQLQGYLALMDQVLANQFSQLAGLSRTFSFKNSVTGTPSQVKDAISRYGAAEQAAKIYPAPYKVFSPAYYYQPLYNVTGIQPLLKDGTTYNFSYTPQTAEAAAEKYWKAYQADPYNAYMFGLMQLMTDPDTDLLRRNDILNHLLARHGESPAVIDTYISGAVYTGNKAQDAVIFKSIYLQNYAILAYNRTKAYNYLGADILNGPSDVYTDIQAADAAADAAQIFAGDTLDFIVQSGKINQLEKIQAADLVNYAATELKINLLLGLRVQYRNFIAANYEAGRSNSTLHAALNTAWWFLRCRRGLIMAETALVSKYLSFQLVITPNPAAGPFFALTAPCFTSAVNINTTLAAESPESLAGITAQGFATYGGQQYPLQQLAAAPAAPGQFRQLAPGSYWSWAQPVTEGLTSPQAAAALLSKTFLFVLPEFIVNTASSGFQQQVSFFLEQELPVNTSFECLYAADAALGQVVQTYTNWHNAMRYRQGGVDAAACSQNAVQFINALTAINSSNT